MKPLNFRKLFTASWIYIPKAADSSSDLAYVTTEEELLKWETAWDTNQVSKTRIFQTALLNSKDIHIIAKYQNTQIVAGFIAYISSDAVGLSNVFNHTGQENIFHQARSFATQKFPGMPIVGYESGQNLNIARKADITILGRLSVWQEQ